MHNQIKLEVATEVDAEQIRDLMVNVEEDEASKWYTDGERPYIPGFDSIAMQQYHARSGHYYKILLQNTLVGVVLISTTGREHARIDRLYIDPQFQGKQIGSIVLQHIENLFPQIRTWTLDTSQKSPRNHYFYEKNGYKLISEDQDERYYRKEVVDQQLETRDFATRKGFNKQNFRECSMQDSDFYDVNLANSSYSNSNMSCQKFRNINLSGSHITNANMSHSIFGDSNMRKVEICHVSLAGAYIHDSNLHNLSVNNCNIEGMKIDGVLVSDLIKAYKSR
ncbi:GNAT family N-acetyltransferase [Paenibacillus anaericanus]|uniref:GNAT family N-acetyltransferase n=1 Tax=Paenibacillus anaericanus TaxID=170367 RepID=A0A433Y5U8_9BACL|nr:GNAT family N-acetyltransferase [Paenibacillus anaericanus]RUT44410.1 GNAT family N-acetyltransferase [Paenibacillus anaericanus]